MTDPAASPTADEASVDPAPWPDVTVGDDVAGDDYDDYVEFGGEA
jgi:hypothetical protein